MKKLLLTTTILMAFALQMNAQTTTKTSGGFAEYLSLGPVAGFGDNWIGHLGGTSRFMPSGYLGVGLIYARNEHWGWGGQLQVSSEGYNVKDGMGNIAKVDPIYLRMPLRAYYFFGNYKSVVRPKIYLGPTLGLKLAENDNFPSNMGDTYMANLGTFRTFDLGLNAGAGVNIKLAHALWLNMDISYYQGLLDAVDDPAGHYNVNHNLAFNAGVLFGIK